MKPSSLTIGLLPGWSVYEKGRIDQYLHSVIQGVRFAAREHGCNLLIACGVNRNPGKRSIHTAWPLAEPDCDFVPVGSWNTDGLIVVTPLGSEARRRQIRQLREEGFPIVFLGTGEGGPCVAIDNAAGIRQCVEHLVKHGHRRIAFIAGDPMDPGDSTIRLQAFREAMADFETEVDSRLMAYGHHNPEDGRKAMEQILSSGASFTAVIASNDSSALGAMEMLHSAGRRVPTDVALVGFDDHPLAAGQVPPLTSIRYPVQEAGAFAVESLLQLLGGPADKPPDERLIPAKLTIRQSCGCLPVYRLNPKNSRSLASISSPDFKEVDRMMQVALQSTQAGLADERAQDLCRRLTASFQQSMSTEDPREFHHALQETLASAESADENLVAWQEVISTLRIFLLPAVGKARRDFAEDLLHQARLIIGDAAARQNLRRQMQISEVNQRIHWMTSLMFKTDKEKEILEIFTESLPGLGIHSAQVVFFETRKGDPFGGLRFSFRPHAGSPEGGGETSHAVCCDSKDFPPRDILQLEKPYALALLPLVHEGTAIGFIAYDAGNMDSLSAITQEMEAAFKAARMVNQVSDLSLSDHLTGVQNRRFFSHFLRREVERCRRYGRSMVLMMMDLDGFREFNESFGSSLGDEALKAIAHCIHTSARRGSDIVCRYEGDAFVVILPETGQDGALLVAETIRSKMRRYSDLYGDLSISIGVAVADTDSFEVESLVDCAGRAMVHAKTAGRNQTVTLPMSSFTQ